MTAKKIVQIIVNLLLFVSLTELLFMPGMEETLFIVLILMYIVTLLVVNRLFEK